MSANNHTCIGDQIFGSTVETKTWDRKNVRALHTNSSAADPHFTCKCCVYVFSWEWNSFIIQRDHQSQSSTNCLGVSWVTAVTVGKSECAYMCACVCVWWQLWVMAHSVAHFSRLGERVRRLAEDAAFLFRRFLSFSEFPNFSLFLRTLKRQGERHGFSIREQTQHVVNPTHGTH